MPDNAALKSLDQLIVEAGGGGDFGKQSKSTHGLLLEHLRSARSSLLGSMPNEYKSSLQEAKVSATCITNKNTQIDIRKRLQNLIGD